MSDRLTYSLGDKIREAIERKRRVETAKRLLREWWAKMFDKDLSTAVLGKT